MMPYGDKDLGQQVTKPLPEPMLTNHQWHQAITWTNVD